MTFNLTQINRLLINTSSGGIFLCALPSIIKELFFDRKEQATIAKSQKKLASCLAIVFVILIANGCSHIKISYPPTEPVVAETLSLIANKNSSLKTFKGIGGINIQNKNQFSKFRIAWAGEYPDHLRMIVLISGSPVETIASDGKTIYIKSHTNAHKLIEKSSRKVDLEKIISIPLTTDDIVSILSGRIPHCTYEYAAIKERIDTKGYVIELSKGWGGVTQRIFLDHEKKPLGFEMVKRGKTLYRALFTSFSTTEGFELPSEISIEAKDSSCSIKVDRYFVNPRIAPGTFKITR